jgi:hypothetical protein
LELEGCVVVGIARDWIEEEKGAKAKSADTEDEDEGKPVGLLEDVKDALERLRHELLPAGFGFVVMLAEASFKREGDACHRSPAFMS